MTYEYPRSIKAAAVLLDTAKLVWYNRINTEALSMQDGTMCILGQLYQTWDDGMICLFDMSDDKYLHDKIFGSRANKEKWVGEIESRRANDSASVLNLNFEDMLFRTCEQVDSNGEFPKDVRVWYTTRLIENTNAIELEKELALAKLTDRERELLGI